MSTSEVTAYLYGAHCAREQITLTQIFVKRHWAMVELAGLDVLASRLRLGGDSFAYWVRRGMDEARQWQA